MNDKFPFAFDIAKMNEAFKMPALDKFFGETFPTFDLAAIQDAHQKNATALLEANKAALAGYQALYKRQTEIFEAAVAEAKDRLAAMQGQPMTAEAATENVEILKSAFEKALAELKELAEMAQVANTDAFDIIKSRTEEIMAEFKAAA